ncbi:nucleotidyltransferase domain-containing protein [Saccharothrix coeruleofusca]|uniref:nucleotidyltransferase domain-containing protein n=1 Tax=Saccharothrix coeruleofusca TaxID=33919 RepID=UPI001E45FF7F|nr:nucleotidyltransferase domain-containing protein [Saccharothrix coeruleofusca]
MEWGVDDFTDRVADRLAALPGVRAVALGGSRAQGTHREDSDWDLAVCYRGGFDPRALRDVGCPGEVSQIGGWGGGPCRTNRCRRTQAAHAVLAARGEWVANEKTLLSRAGLDAVDGITARVEADPVRAAEEAHRVLSAAVRVATG